MTHLIDDLYLDADEYQLVLTRRKVVGETGRGGHLTKAENIGKERFETIGYYATLNAAVNAVLKMKTRELVRGGAEDLSVLTRGLKEYVHTIKNAVVGLKNALPPETTEE